MKSQLVHLIADTALWASVCDDLESLRQDLWTDSEARTLPLLECWLINSCPERHLVKRLDRSHSEAQQSPRPSGAQRLDVCLGPGEGFRVPAR